MARSVHSLQIILFFLERQITIRNLFVFTIVLALLVALIFFLFEVRERRKHKKRFRALTESQLTDSSGMRAFPRVSIPETMNVRMTFSCAGNINVKGRIVNISTAGFCLRCESGLERLILNHPLRQVRVQTPINEFVVQELKPIWLVEENRRKLLGLQVVEIVEPEAQHINAFMAYLKDYLLHVV